MFGLVFGLALMFLMLGIWFYLGFLYGQYKYEPPECQRRHRDELPF